MHCLFVENTPTVSKRLQQSLEHRIEEISVSRVDWQDLQAINQELQQLNADYIVFSVSLSIASSSAELQKLQQHFAEVVRLAVANNLPVMLLSRADVFSGKQRYYHEAERPQPQTAIAEAYAYCEQFLQENNPRHIVLRSSWLFDGEGENFLTQALPFILSGERVAFNSAAKACPTAVADLARVIQALLLQLPLMQDEGFGVYHYVSSDTALGFQFVEAIVAQAAQYHESVDAKNLHFEHNFNPDTGLYFEPVVLSCNKLLTNFGIHQKSWRTFISAAVKQYFEARQK